MKTLLLLFLLIFYLNGDSNRFITKRNIVIDTTTDLIWQKEPNPELITYKEAKSYCDKLQIKGYKWRIPTIRELMTLSNKSNVKENDIDIRDGFYWSSTPYKPDNTKVWLLDFQNEFSSKYYKNSNARVICVTE